MAKNKPNSFGNLLAQKIIQYRKDRLREKTRDKYVWFQGAKFVRKSQPTPDTVEIIISALTGKTVIVPLDQVYDFHVSLKGNV